MEKEFHENLKTLKNILKVFETTYSSEDELSDIVVDLQGLSKKITKKLEH